MAPSPSPPPHTHARCELQPPAIGGGARPGAVATAKDACGIATLPERRRGEAVVSPGLPVRARSRRVPGTGGGKAGRGQAYSCGCRDTAGEALVAARARRPPLRFPAGACGLQACASGAFGDLLPRAPRSPQVRGAAVAVLGSSFLSLMFRELLWQALPVSSDGTATSAKLDFPVINSITNHSYLFHSEKQTERAC